MRSEQLINDWATEVHQSEEWKTKEKQETDAGTEAVTDKYVKLN